MAVAAVVAVAAVAAAAVQCFEDCVTLGAIFQLELYLLGLLQCDFYHES